VYHPDARCVVWGCAERAEEGRRTWSWRGEGLGTCQPAQVLAAGCPSLELGGAAVNHWVARPQNDSTRMAKWKPETPDSAIIPGISMAASPAHFERISWGGSLSSTCRKFLAVQFSAPPCERVSKKWCADPGPLNLQCRTRDFPITNSSPTPSLQYIHLPQPSLHHPRGEIGHFGPPVLVLITARRPSAAQA